MSDIPRSTRLAITGAIAVALLLSLGAASAEERVPAAVMVEAPSQGDSALARQIQTLFVATLKDKGLQPVNFGREDVSDREATILKEIDEAFARVTAGMRSKPFDEANETLNRAFFEAKQILGRIDPALLARLYKAFAAAQVTLGRRDLGEDYVAASLNMDSEQSPRSFQYFSDMNRVVEQANKRVKGPRQKATITATPESARILVDGKDLGHSPVEISLGGGPHLIQVRADGFHPQGWMKEVDGESRWSFQLRPLPAWKRFTSLRQEAAAQLRLDKAGRAAAANGEELPLPACPGDLLGSLGRLVEAPRVVFASVESVGDRIAVRGCHKAGDMMIPFALVLSRDGSLLKKIRAALEATLDQARPAKAARPSPAALAEKSAVDPLLRRMDAVRGGVERRLEGIAARERHLRSLGLAEKNSRFRVVRGPLESLLTDLDEAARVYPKDKTQCTRLVRGAEDRLRRMKDMLLSMDAWDPSGEARARDEARAVKDLRDLRGAVADGLRDWKTARRKVKDRELRKRLDTQSKNLRKDLKSLDKAMKKAPGKILPFASRLLALMVEAKGLSREAAATLEEPQPMPAPKQDVVMVKTATPVAKSREEAAPVVPAPTEAVVLDVEPEPEPEPVEIEAPPAPEDLGILAPDVEPDPEPDF